MPMNDGFDPDHTLPCFLSDREDERQQWTASLLDLPAPSRILGVSILSTVVMAGGIAIALSLGNPVKLVAAMASLPRGSAVQRGGDQSTPTIQSASDVRTGAAGAEPADQAQTESREPPPGVLLAQFQAWAAKVDTRPQDLAQPQDQAQDQEQEQASATLAKAAPFPIASEDPAPEQPTHKHRATRSVKDSSLQNARADIRHVQKPRARVQREQNAPGPAPAGQYALAQPPLQTAQPPSFLQSLGIRQ